MTKVGWRLLVTSHQLTHGVCNADGPSRGSLYYECFLPLVKPGAVHPTANEALLSEKQSVPKREASKNGRKRASSSPGATRGDDGDGVHFAKYFTTKDGRKVWAEDYGYDAWPIPIG